MKPRYGVLFTFIGQEFVVTKVDGPEIQITDRESRKRYRWTVGGFERALASGAVVIDSTMEKRQTDDAIRIGRAMAFAAIKRHDKPMTNAGAARAFSKMLGMEDWVAKIAADEYTKTWAAQPKMNPLRGLFRFRS